MSFVASVASRLNFSRGAENSRAYPRVKRSARSTPYVFAGEYFIVTIAIDPARAGVPRVYVRIRLSGYDFDSSEEEDAE